MKRSRSLCFTGQGLYNTKDISYIKSKPSLTTIVLAGDGSASALDRIKEFQDDPILKEPHIGRILIAKTPQYEMRVRGPEDGISLPNYLYSEEDTIKWICSKAAAPHFSIEISDITSQSGTSTLLEPEDVEALCYRAYQFWEVLKIAEDRLCFPAIVIDRLTPLTYNMTPGTIDIFVLRRETGLSSLEYEPTNDVLSVVVGGDTFSAKLSVLNEFYSNIILPIANKLLIRRIRLMVTIQHQNIEATPMTYGQIGQIISHMTDHVITREINSQNPLSPADMMQWAAQLRVEDESCIWVNRDESISEVIEKHRSSIISETGPSDDDD